MLLGPREGRGGGGRTDEIPLLEMESVEVVERILGLQAILVSYRPSHPPLLCLLTSRISSKTTYAVPPVATEPSQLPCVRPLAPPPLDARALSRRTSLGLVSYPYLSHAAVLAKEVVQVVAARLVVEVLIGPRLESAPGGHARGKGELEKGAYLYEEDAVGVWRELLACGSAGEGLAGKGRTGSAF